MNAPLAITILGATGSIGKNTLRVLDHARENYQLVALTAQDNVHALADLALQYQPQRVVIGNAAQYATLKEILAGTSIEVAAGMDALIEAAALPCDVVVAGIVGSAGLAPTLAALQPNRRVLLANKECLVCAGDVFMRRARETGAVLLPIDSEHNALFQLIDPTQHAAITKLTLTASGGPFRGWTAEQMAMATPEQATAHPTWKMGAKISIDSATMMNKGLEMIEAYHLFPVRADQINVVVHPQSVIHSMVSYEDGSTLAHLSATDMAVPISHALHWPHRRPCPVAPLDLTTLGTLTFEAPDEVRFPALKLARQALQAGLHATLTLNAANEVAVSAFLQQDIAFTSIASTVARMLERSTPIALDSVDDILAMDAHVRATTWEILHRPTGARFVPTRLSASQPVSDPVD